MFILSSSTTALVASHCFPADNRTHHHQADDSVSVLLVDMEMGVNLPKKRFKIREEKPKKNLRSVIQNGFLNNVQGT